MAAATGGQTLGAVPPGEDIPKTPKAPPRPENTTAIEWQIEFAEYMELLIANGHVNVSQYTPAQVMYYTVILVNRLARTPIL